MLTCDYFDLYQLTTLRMCLIELQITRENNKYNKINSLQNIVIKVWFL